MGYSVVGVEETFESLYLAPAFQGLDRVSVTNVVRFEEIPVLRESLTPVVRWSA